MKLSTDNTDFCRSCRSFNIATKIMVPGNTVMKIKGLLNSLIYKLNKPAEDWYKIKTNGFPWGKPFVVYSWDY